MLANPAIADSVTAMGRKHIEDTKQAVLQHPEHGHLARLIYEAGQRRRVRTDSLDDAWRWGKEVEHWLNTVVLPPMGRCLRMELGGEVARQGYVLLAKKMYFGRMYPNGPAGGGTPPKKDSVGEDRPDPFLLRIYQGLVGTIFPEGPDPAALRRDNHADPDSIPQPRPWHGDEQSADLSGALPHGGHPQEQMRAGHQEHRPLPTSQMVMDLKKRIGGDDANVTVPKPGGSASRHRRGVGSISSAPAAAIVKMDLDDRSTCSNCRTAA